MHLSLKVGVSRWQGKARDSSKVLNGHRSRLLYHEGFSIVSWQSPIVEDFYWASNDWRFMPKIRRDSLESSARFLGSKPG